MYKNMKELTNEKRNAVAGLKKIDMLDGIKRLLTYIYPHSAHFIFELLQNAEDCEATRVSFKLYEDKLIFEHNGPRLFSLEDVDAITNIGNNVWKQQSSTSIGEFGIGFKAVYEYTDTPEIHSGDFHFKIKDYFIPITFKVDRKNLKDSSGQKLTRFILPFDKKDVQPAAAVSNIQASLLKLDETAILFLDHIQEIDFYLPDGSCGQISKARSDTDNDNFISIKRECSLDEDEMVTNWLIFEAAKKIRKGRAVKKQPISIAFALEKKAPRESAAESEIKEVAAVSSGSEAAEAGPTSESEAAHSVLSASYRVIPVPSGGKACIYFPADKEYTGLRFHINAPFASTAARDSIRDREENAELISDLADLLEKSMRFIKREGMMDFSFLSVLPNKDDHLSDFYMPMLTACTNAFASNAYLKEKYANAYLCSEAAMRGPSYITRVMSPKDIEYLTGIKKRWIDLPDANSYPRALKFIDTLGVTSVQEATFQVIFLTGTGKIESLAAKKNSVWLKNFYEVGYEVFRKSSAVAPKLRESLRNCRFIQGKDKQMYLPSEIYLLKGRQMRNGITIPVVNPSLLSDESTGKIKHIETFLGSDLGIKNYTEKVEIEAMIKRSSGITEPTSEYFSDLKKILKYRKTHQDIDLKDVNLFFCLDPASGAVSQKPASDLAIGDDYDEPYGSILAGLLGLPLLWAGYKDNLSSPDVKLLLNDIKKCGAVYELKIDTSAKASDHPNFSELQKKAYGNRGKGTNTDAVIPYLDKVLEAVQETGEMIYSQMIADCLKKYGSSSLGNMIESFTKARYSLKKNTEIFKMDSSLVYMLKNAAWIPDKEGNLFKPADIQVGDIHSELGYNSKNPIFKSLEIGSGRSQKKKDLSKLQEQAQNLGRYVISADDYALLEKYKQMLEKQKQASYQTVQKQLQNKTTTEKKVETEVTTGKKPIADAPILPESAGTVRNAERRTAKVEEKFDEAREEPVKGRLQTTMVYPTNEEERNRLKTWYSGKCQICGTSIIKKNGEPYFHAKNVLDSSKNPEDIRATEVLGWNSLCLCPNCAAKYDYCDNDLSGLYEQIASTEVIENSKEPIKLQFVLDRKEAEISYKPAHFHILKTVTAKMDELINENDLNNH